MKNKKIVKAAMKDPAIAGKLQAMMPTIATKADRKLAVELATKMGFKKAPKAPKPDGGAAPAVVVAPSKREEWQSMKAQNPRLAAQFYNANHKAIDADWAGVKKDE